MNLRKVVSVVAAMSLAAAANASAQKADSGAFFVRLGADTLAVERYVRNPQQLVAEAILRTPQTRAMKLTITFRDDGTVSWYEVLNNPVAGVPNSAPVIRNLITYLGDSARVETWAGGVQRPTRVIASSRGLVPLQPPFYSTYEAALAPALRSAGDTATVSMFSAVGPFAYRVERHHGGDTVTISNPQAGSMSAVVDKDGRLVRLDGSGTTFKVIVSRTKWIDLASYAKRYASIDAAGKAIGTLSPRDTVFYDAGDHAVMVDYSRPSKRGRRIFGGIVPWGEVWRTGANAATQIEFAKNVEINGVAVPAGKYTLWSIPDTKQWQIILNKQTGQWGTIYDPKQDVVRIPVRTESVAVPVEMFEIAMKPAKGATMMTMTWDRTRVIVPIEAK